MSEPFLIAHKVRGAAAFDVAERMECPECAGIGEAWGLSSNRQFHCAECDSLGYWWIIPTSGHRAYPWDYIQLDTIISLSEHTWGEMPSGLQDHFKSGPAPKLDIRSLFKPQPKPTIQRRF